MRYLLALSVLLILNINTIAQSKPQLRLRTGASKAFLTKNASDNNGLYKMNNALSINASGIGVEYYKPLKKEGRGLVLGIFMTIQTFAIDINAKKFSTIPASETIESSYTTFRLYVGQEKRLGKISDQIHKNYISIFGAIGISFNPMGDGQGSWMGKEVGDGITTDGKAFKGVFYTGPGSSQLAGYFTQVRAHKAATLSPDISGGLRYNIQNQKGKTVFVAETILTYGITNKYYIDMSYTLDSQEKVDRLKDRGTNLQLNLLIPLYTFRK